MEIGGRIGRYQIDHKIGRGGMGEVYLAIDTLLQRPVALKLLPQEFLEDVSRCKRFRQEARAASALNHPNIVTVHEIGESQQGFFIATEFVKGATLREILSGGPLSPTEAVRIADQIARGLSAAHAAGIVHRDIKPENIMLRDDGYVKILDFGLAKLTNWNGPGHSGLESTETMPGMVLGSASYMSPEQARGLPVGPPTDVWSLGVVLYEMLSGIAPFTGPTPSDTIAAVIHVQPPKLISLVSGIPSEVSHVVERAIHKDPGLRYPSMDEFAHDLRKALTKLEQGDRFGQKTITDPANKANETRTLIYTTDPGKSGEIVGGTSHRSRQSLALSRSGRLIKMILIGLAVVAIAGTAVLTYSILVRRRPAAARSFDSNQISRIETDGKVRLPRISPDGKYVAYVAGDIGTRSLVVRQVATGSVVTVVPPTELDFRSVAFSPTGDYLYYTLTGKNFSVNTLYRVPTLGGTARKVTEDVDSAPTFSPDGKQIAFLRHVSREGTDVILIGSPEGSNYRQLATTAGSEYTYFSLPSWSPDGSNITIGAGRNNGGIVSKLVLAQIAVSDGHIASFGSKEWSGIDSICWFSDGSGFLVAGQDVDSPYTQIWRVEYHGGHSEQLTNDFNNYFSLSLSSANNLAIAVRSDVSQGLWRFDPRTKGLEQLVAERRNLFWDYRVSQFPNGRFVFSRREAGTVSIRSMAPDGNDEQVLVADADATSNPVLTPDGRFIVFASKRSNNSTIWRVDADGNNLTQITFGEEGTGDFNPQILPDGKSIIFQRQRDADYTICQVPITGGSVVTVLADPEHNYLQPLPSSDGRFLAIVTFDRRTYDRSLRILATSDNGSTYRVERDVEYSLIDNFSWAPDSKSLTLLLRSPEQHLWRLPVAGGQMEPLSDFRSRQISNFFWSRDGTSIYLVSSISNNDLILLADTGR